MRSRLMNKQELKEFNNSDLYRLEGMGMEEGITASEVMVFGTEL